jgi:hypothetical protein
MFRRKLFVNDYIKRLKENETLQKCTFLMKIENHITEIYQDRSFSFRDADSSMVSSLGKILKRLFRIISIPSKTLFSSAKPREYNKLNFKEVIVCALKS